MYTDIFADCLIELAEKDERIVAVTPAMPGGSGLLKFAKQFPNRMIDVGIAEQHAATMCAAIAGEGLKPVFAVYSTFLQRAYDQVVHDICRMELNVIFAIDRAGFVGPDGETHHGVYDIAFLRHIPNIVIMMPKDENELRNMMYTALQYNDGPIAVRYPRVNTPGAVIDTVMSELPIGKWEVVIEGTGPTILAVGPMVQLAEEAADHLKREGIALRVINARYIKPLDEAMLLQLANDNVDILTLEETSEMGGFGSSVLEFYASRGIYNLRVKPIGIPDYFVEHGSIKEQRIEVGLDVERIITEVKNLIPEQRQRA
jgi:1-deoxy-D-xylulose-5-phosphate synthase